MSPEVFAHYFDVHPDHRQQLGFATSLFDLIQGDLGLPPGSMFNFYPGEGAGFVLRILPPEFYCAVPRWMEGENGMGIRFVPGLISQERMAAAMREDARALGLGNVYERLHDEKKVFPKNHPFMVLVHDLFHLYQLMRMPKDQRAELMPIYDLFERMKTERPAAGDFWNYGQDIIMDGYPEGYGHHAPLFMKLAAFQHPSLELGLHLQRRFAEVFAGSPRREQILEALSREFFGVADVEKLLRTPEGGEGPKNGGGLGDGTLHSVFFPGLLALSGAGGEGIFSGWETPGLLALGVGAATGLGIWAYRRWQATRPRGLERFAVSLNPRERGLMSWALRRTPPQELRFKDYALV
ncbi:MAG: hypothetical protein ACREP8_07320, partial [Candidatus Binatia bacterium]